MSQMGTPSHYADRVPRQPWTPETEEDAAIGVRVAELYRKWREAEEEYKHALADAAQPEGPLKIAYLASVIGIERKTVYRHLGRSMT